MDLQTQIVDGEIILTLNAKLEDWDKIKFIIDTYLAGFEAVREKKL